MTRPAGLPWLGGAAAVSVVCFAVATGLMASRADAEKPRPSAVSAAGITLHSVSVALPAGGRMLPGGAKAEAINNNCLGCHSAGMILAQPALSRSAWRKEVDKMRKTYKAPINPDDVPAIVAYLTSQKNLR